MKLKELTNERVGEIWIDEVKGEREREKVKKGGG